MGSRLHWKEVLDLGTSHAVGAALPQSLQNVISYGIAEAISKDPKR
jgi:hypothetical protein